MPFVKESLALSTSAVSWHFSAYALGRLSSGFPARRLVEKQAGLSAIRLVALALLVVMTGFAFSPSKLMTVPAALLIGFCGGLLQALTQAQFAGLPDRVRSVAIGEAYVVASLGVFLCPVSIGFVAKHSWPWMAALSIPTLVLAMNLFILRPAAAAGARPRQVSAGSKGSRTSFAVVTFWALVFCGNAIEWGIGLWGPQLLQQKLGLSTADAVSLMGLYFGATIAGRIINTRLLRRFECEHLFVAYICLGWVAVVVIFMSSLFPLVMAGLVVAGACLGCFYPLNLATAMKYAPDNISLITSGAAKCSGLALLAVPLTLGYASDVYGLLTAILVLGGIPPIMGIFLVSVIRGHRKSADAA